MRTNAVNFEKKGMGGSLTWLVLVGILPIIAFSIGMAWLVIDRQTAAAEADLGNTARALGVAIDIIVQATGLSREEVEAL